MAAGGEVRYTSTGAEFRIVTVQEITAGFDDMSWWRECPLCHLSLQGGEAALAEHREKVCKDS